jgi:hypothetical protein
MLYTLFYALFRLVFGTLYPAYASYKAVRTKNVKEYVSRASVATFFICITGTVLDFSFAVAFSLLMTENKARMNVLSYSVLTDTRKSIALFKSSRGSSLFLLIRMLLR